MVNYKELGLVNTRDMFARAIKGGLCNSCIQLQPQEAAGLSSRLLQN